MRTMMFKIEARISDVMIEMFFDDESPSEIMFTHLLDSGVRPVRLIDCSSRNAVIIQEAANSIRKNC